MAPRYDKPSLSLHSQFEFYWCSFLAAYLLPHYYRSLLSQSKDLQTLFCAVINTEACWVVAYPYYRLFQPKASYQCTTHSMMGFRWTQECGIWVQGEAFHVFQWLARAWWLMQWLMQISTNWTLLQHPSSSRGCTSTVHMTWHSSMTTGTQLFSPSCA